MRLHWVDLHGWMLERRSAATVRPNNCSTVLLEFSLPCLSMLQNWKMYSYGVIHKPQIAVTRLCCDSCITISFPSRIFSMKKTQPTIAAATQSIFWSQKAQSNFRCGWGLEYDPWRCLQHASWHSGFGNYLGEEVLPSGLQLLTTLFCRVEHYNSFVELTNFILCEKIHTVVHCPIQEKLSSV